MDRLFDLLNQINLGIEVSFLRPASHTTLLLPIVFLVSCTNDFADFVETATEMATDDERIDKEEYNKLCENITSSDSRSFEKFKDAEGKVDNKKLDEYLTRLFDRKLASRKIKIERGSEQVTPQEGSISSYSINVYLENSASMDGYITGITDFEENVYSFISRIKHLDNTDTLNLFYINSKIADSNINADMDVLEDFIKKLEPDDFKARGGDRSFSDISEIIELTAEKTKGKSASIIISDFIVSHKNVHCIDSADESKDPLRYLPIQTTGLTNSLIEELEKHNLGFLVLKFSSQFDGSYYTKYDCGLPLKSRRPYYIWIIGDQGFIESLKSYPLADLTDKKIEDEVLFLKSIEPTDFRYKVLRNPQIGEFELDRKDPGQSIIECKTERRNQNKGYFGFTVAVDFSAFSFDPSYFMDTSNYSISNGSYMMTVERIQDLQNPGTKGFTHLLHFKTKTLRSETLNIKVQQAIPGWVEATTSLDDTNIRFDAEEKKKTFGFRYLIKGVADAYKQAGNWDELCIISINIEKD